MRSQLHLSVCAFSECPPQFVQAYQSLEHIYDDEHVEEYLSTWGSWEALAWYWQHAYGKEEMLEEGGSDGVLLPWPCVQ